ncbi:MAG TPA: DMT family transporter [Patescibacteria group bacterium]|nr:DMT family transporter [Patescibacteria group bacterium]
MTSPLLMMLSVRMFSLYPLLAVIGLRESDPILFVAVAHISCGLVAAILAGQRLRDAKRTPKNHGLDRPTIFYIAATAVAGAVNHMCFMFALLKTSPSGATIIYETWPIIGAWLAPVLLEKTGAAGRRSDYLFGLFALIGIAFVIAGGSHGLLTRIDLSLLAAVPAERLTGYGLAFIGAAGVAISTALRRRLSQRLTAAHGGDRVIGVCLASAFTRLGALPVFALGYALLDTTATITLQGAAIAVVTGIGIQLLGSLFYLFSVLRNPNPAIPVPDFVAPVLSVLWLTLAGVAQLSDLAVLGGLFVITANLLVTVRAEDGFAYTASILTILLGGAWCYFTQGGALADFYDAVSLSAVFYAILIAFAWDRVLERAKQEESLALDIAYGIEALKADTKPEPTVLKRLVSAAASVIETTNRTAIRDAYHALIKLRAELGARGSAGKVFRDLDSLILSKTKDIMLSEIVLLCLIGGITFFGILGYRPEGLWPDMMAFIMGGAIVFIFFAIFDQKNARKGAMLKADGDSLCLIRADAFQSRDEFKLVTIVLIGIMLAVFYGLFRYKYALT